MKREIIIQVMKNNRVKIDGDKVTATLDQIMASWMGIRQEMMMEDEPSVPTPCVIQRQSITIDQAIKLVFEECVLCAEPQGKYESGMHDIGLSIVKKLNKMR